MKIRFEFVFLALIIGALIVFSPGVVKSDTVADNATVDVTISAVTEITINTTSLNWGSASTGANTTAVEVKVENTGSNDVGNIYAHVDTIDKETTNPWLAPSTPGGWAAATFLDVGNGSVASSPTYYYVGHSEWNRTDLTDGGGYTLNSSADSLGYGRVWIDCGDATCNTEDFFHWQVVNGSDGYCNHSSAVFRLQTTRNSKDVDGGTDASQGQATTDWATWTMASGPLADYCIATYYDCTKIYLYRYDYNSTFGTCSTKEYLVAGGPMAPSNYIITSMRARVEAGHIQGATTQSNLRVYASSV